MTTIDEGIALCVDAATSGRLCADDAQDLLQMAGWLVELKEWRETCADDGDEEYDEYEDACEDAFSVIAVILGLPED